MNAWRWLGLSLFLAAGLCFVVAANIPALAGGDKTKTPTAPDTKGKTTETPKKTDAVPDNKGKTEPPKKTETPTPAGDKLEFKAFTGKPFYTEQTTETEQTMTVMGQKVKQEQKQTFLILWTPKEKVAGDYVVEQQIAGVDMKIDIGGNTISYKSTGKNAKNPMTDFFEALMKKESALTFTITPDLNVKSIEGRDKFVKNLTDINPQMQGLLKAILSDEALKKMAEPTWWAYPKDGVLPAVGASWDRKSTLSLGPIGTYETKFVFTTKSVTADKATIGIKTTLAYTAPTDKAGLPFVIQKAELKGDNGEGEAVFDRAKGRFESTKLNMTLTGKITIEVGNMQTDVDLNQTQKSTSKTYDDMPAEWKTAK